MSYKKKSNPTHAQERRVSSTHLKRLAPKEISLSSEPQVRSNAYVPYYSNEFRDIVRYIQTDLGKKVYLIGIRAMFERGVPLWRFTDDFDVYTPLTNEERDKIIDFVRKKYEGAKHVWLKFGFGLDFDPIGHIDVNIITPTVQNESWEEETIQINGVQVFLPPLEDILILKLLSPRRKDAKDVGVALRLARDKVNFERLKAKAEKVGASKKLLKLIKKYGENV
jgi:DNA-binding cell septation regulator SpoVG